MSLTPRSSPSNAFAAQAHLPPTSSSLTQCIEARLRALPLAAHDARSILEYELHEAGLPPTRNKVMQLISMRADRYAGLFRGGDRIEIEVGDVSVVPAVSGAAPDLLRWLYFVGTSTWFTAIDQCFRGFLVRPEALSAYVAAKGDPPQAWVQYEQRFLGGIVVKSDRARGPSSDLRARFQECFTQQTIDRFVARVEQYPAEVDCRIRAIRDLLTMAEARDGLLTSAAIQRAVGASSVFDPEEARNAVSHWGVQNESYVETMLRSTLGKLASFEPDEEVPGGFQISMRSSDWWICFDGYVASLPWILNANALLAVCHLSPLSAKMRLGV